MPHESEHINHRNKSGTLQMHIIGLSLMYVLTFSGGIPAGYIIL